MSAAAAEQRFRIGPRCRQQRFKRASLDLHSADQYDHALTEGASSESNQDFDGWCVFIDFFFFLLKGPVCNIGSNTLMRNLL